MKRLWKSKPLTNLFIVWLRERSEKEAREKELARLKSHMLLMEETSTAEAIEAEKREMELRAMISDLQKSHHSATEGASEQSRVLEVFHILKLFIFGFSAPSS